MTHRLDAHCVSSLRWLRASLIRFPAPTSTRRISRLVACAHFPVRHTAPYIVSQGAGAVAASELPYLVASGGPSFDPGRILRKRLWHPFSGKSFTAGGTRVRARDELMFVLVVLGANT